MECRGYRAFQYAVWSCQKGSEGKSGLWKALARGTTKITKRGGATPKKRKMLPPEARSELFESEDEEDIAPTATEEPVGGSESETDDETD